jgi:hypothetical protein
VKRDRPPLEKVLIMAHNFESAMMESRFLRCSRLVPGKPRNDREHLSGDDTAHAENHAGIIRNIVFLRRNEKSTREYLPRTFFIQGGNYPGIVIGI